MPRSPDKAQPNPGLRRGAFAARILFSGALKPLTRDERWERVSRIPAARIDITDARGNASTDLFTLLKTAEGWRIVNKVLSNPL